MTQASKLIGSLIVTAAAFAAANSASGRLVLAADKTAQPAVGDTAADFELKTLDGQSVKLSGLTA